MMRIAGEDVPWNSIHGLLRARALEHGDAPRVDIAETVRFAADMVAEMARNGDVVCSFAIDADLPAFWGDAKKLRQVVINLLSNAIKFTPPYGTVSLRAARATDGGAAISIADTGIGIASEQIPVALAPSLKPPSQVIVPSSFRKQSQIALWARAVAARPARAAIVGRYAHLDFFALHMHHETEDTALWDRLTARDPGCAVHVGQMRAQHAEVAAQLARIEPQLQPWVDSADPALGVAFAGDIETLRDTLTTHLAQEESDIMPVAGAVLSHQSTAR